MKEYSLFIFVAFCSVFIRQSLSAQTNCNGQWQAYGKCLTDELAKTKDVQVGLGVPGSSAQKNLLVSQIRACFRENNCKDPFAPEAQNRIAGQCFPKSFAGLRQELKTCVTRQVSNFVFIDDQYSLAKTETDVLYLLAAAAAQDPTNLCPAGVDKQRLTTCLRNKQGLSTGQTSGQNAFCTLRQRCKSTSFLSQSCTDEWSTDVCVCVQSLRFLGTVSKFENQYIDCMKTGGYTVDKSRDVPLKWFDLGVKGWCRSDATPSWSPDNAGCNGTVVSVSTTVASTTSTKTTKKPATTTTRRTTTIETTTLAEPELTPETPPPEETTTEPTGEETTLEEEFPETTPSDYDPDATTTRYTFFFESFTDENSYDDPEEEATTPVTTVSPPAATTSGNWLTDWLGLPNPMDGILGQILDFSNVFGNNGLSGKKRR